MNDLNRLDQQESNSVVLWRVSHEEIEIDHDAADHLGSQASSREFYEYTESNFAESALRPDLKSNGNVCGYQFKICSVRRYQAGPVSAGSEGNQNVEMQVSQLLGAKSFFRTNFAQNLSGFKPIL